MKFQLSLSIVIEAYDTSYKFNADSSTNASLLKNKNTNKRTIDKFYVRLIFEIRQYNYMQIDIPSSCPSCGGKMYSVSYESVLPDLKKRSWQVCKECNFERNSEDFKKSICCVQQMGAYHKPRDQQYIVQLIFRLSSN